MSYDDHIIDAETKMSQCQQDSKILHKKYNRAEAGVPLRRLGVRQGRTSRRKATQIDRG